VKRLAAVFALALATTLAAGFAPAAAAPNHR